MSRQARLVVKNNGRLIEDRVMDFNQACNLRDSYKRQGYEASIWNA